MYSGWLFVEYLTKQCIARHIQEIQSALVHSAHLYEQYTTWSADHTTTLKLLEN